MALAKTDLTYIVSIGSAATVGIYTNPASTKTFIKAFVIHNVGISTALCTLYDVPPVAGNVGTAGSLNQFYNQVVTAGETVFIEYPYPLTLTATNHSIRFFNSTAGQRINVQIIGDKDI